MSHHLYQPFDRIPVLAASPPSGLQHPATACNEPTSGSLHNPAPRSLQRADQWLVAQPSVQRADQWPAAQPSPPELYLPTGTVCNEPTSGSPHKPAPRSDTHPQRGPPAARCQPAARRQPFPPTARPPSGTLPTFPTRSAAPQRRAADPTARYQHDADQLPHANPGIPMSHYKGYKSFARSIQRSCERFVKLSERCLQRLRRQGIGITRENLKDHHKA
jgi:hypothetical protein